MRLVIVSILTFLLFFQCDKIGIESEIVKVITTLDKDKIYRETDSKNGLISRNYNISPSSMTHVGIGFFDKNELFKIFHIDLNQKKESQKNDIIVSSISEFFDLKDCSVLGGEIWRYDKEFSDKEFNEIHNYIDSMFLNTNIKFDIDFDYEDSNKLYCSELVSKFLTKFSKDSYTSDLKSKKVNNIHRLYLKKDTVKYIPVDYFMTLPSFQKVYQFKSEV